MKPVEKAHADYIDLSFFKKVYILDEKYSRFENSMKVTLTNWLLASVALMLNWKDPGQKQKFVSKHKTKFQRAKFIPPDISVY